MRIQIVSFFQKFTMASHLPEYQVIGNVKGCGGSIKKYFLFQSIDKIMFQYKNHEQNILINYLIPDKKSGNTIH